MTVGAAEHADAEPPGPWRPPSARERLQILNAVSYTHLDVYKRQLDQTAAAARTRKSRLDEVAGREYMSDALHFVGTPAELADTLEEWQGAGLSGFLSLIHI